MWLLGNRQSEQNTPVHRWALDAFKNALVADSPMHGPVLIDSPAPNGPSILKTPGQNKREKRVSVTFDKSVRTPPKTRLQSGLPNTFPGKFPSPYTPRTIAHDDPESEAENDVASPISKEKDSSESRRGNSLKALHVKLDRTLKIEPKSKPVVAIQPRTVAQRKVRHKSLDWDVEKGFEEVLDCITKNNTYLQSLIDEMQESQTIMDETMTIDGSIYESEATINLDEPRSKSGHYWKQKFLDFSLLTEQVKREQNNMERALDKLRQQVDHREMKQAEDNKDRYDILKEEFEKEKRTNATSSHMRVVRELRRKVAEFETQVNGKLELEAQLAGAESQILDLQNKLKTRPIAERPVSQREIKPVTSAAPDLSIISTTEVSERRPFSSRPMSSTARRLEAARQNSTKALTTIPINEPSILDEDPTVRRQRLEKMWEDRKARRAQGKENQIK